MLLHRYFWISLARVVLAVVCFIGAPRVWAAGSLDLDKTAKSIVLIQAQVPPTARSAKTLGLRRQGNGIVIDDQGLVLTIGYLILEAEMIGVFGAGGAAVEADYVAYDHATGFGLIRAKGALGVPPVRLGNSESLSEKTAALAMASGGLSSAVPVQVVSRRPFAGFWEYLLESGIYTLPAHPNYGGAALIDEKGELVGVGSLLINNGIEDNPGDLGNLFVPINLLKPILADMIATGRRGGPGRPWLGVYANDESGRVLVTRLAEGGPAEKAGVKAGDIIMGVGGKRVRDMVSFYRRVNATGKAGVDISLDLLQRGAEKYQIKQITVTSADRHDWLNLPKSEMPDGAAK